MTQQGGSRRRGRPPRPVLNRGRITTEALKLIGRTGEAGFTMAALAKQLKVSTSALYNHAPSKEVILRWVQDEVNASIDVSCFATDPLPDALRTWAHSYREAYIGFPALVQIIAMQPVADSPHTIAMYETVTAAMTKAGFDGADAIDAIVALESFIFGSALDTAAPDDIFDTVPADGAATFAAAVQERHARHGRGRGSADAAFTRGLDALLRGLVAR